MDIKHMQTIKLPGMNGDDNGPTTVVLPDADTRAFVTTVEINLNQDVILRQLRKAKMPMFAKKMGSRILAVCLEKNSGTLWFNQLALCSLRKSVLIGDAYDALNRLKQAGIVDWHKEKRSGQDVAVVRLKAWE